jgi:hypothetical protein
MKQTIAVWVALIAATSLSLPAAAANVRTTGDQVSLFGCPDVPADTPFHVLHGHRFDPNETDAVGRWTFELMVDGVLLPVSHVRVVEAIEPPGGPSPSDSGSFLARGYVYNFPDGLGVGTHDLHGVWTEPDGDTFQWTCTIDF